MYIVFAPILIKAGHETDWINGILENAPRFVGDEPGCMQFDVIQDAGDASRFWLYEVYRDEEAFKQHGQNPRLIEWREMSKEWRIDGQQPAAKGSTIWPPDDRWS